MLRLLFGTELVGIVEGKRARFIVYMPIMQTCTSMLQNEKRKEKETVAKLFFMSDKLSFYYFYIEISSDLCPTYRHSQLFAMNMENH